MSQSKLTVGWSGPLGSHFFLRVVCRLLSWSLSWLRSRPKRPWREFLFADFPVRVWKGFLMVCLRATPPSPSYELPPMSSPLPSPLCKSHQAGHSGWWLAHKALYSWCSPYVSGTSVQVLTVTLMVLWCSFRSYYGLQNFLFKSIGSLSF